MTSLSNQPKAQTLSIDNSNVIYRDPQIRTFFRAFWNEPGYADFFLSTKDELFQTFDDPSFPFSHLPYLYFINEPKNRKGHGLTVLKALHENKETKKEQLFPKENFVDSKDEIMANLAAFILFCLHRILQKNPVLFEELTKSETSYASIMRILKKNKDQIMFNVFEEIQKNAASIWKNEIQPLAGDSALNAMMIKFIDFAKKEFQGQLNKGIMLNVPQLNEVNHIFICADGYEKQSNIISDDETDYDNLLGDMYAKKLISTLTMISWCSECIDDPYISMSLSKLGPQQAKFKCPKCRLALCVAGAFELPNSIKELIFSKDGVISGAVAWILSEKNIKFEQNKYIGDFEVDFIFKLRNEVVTIECKQHKTPMGSDASAIRNSLDKDIAQISRTTRALKSNGFEVNKSILLTNYPLDADIKEEIDKLKRKRKDIFTNDLVIMDCDTFRLFISEK